MKLAAYGILATTLGATNAFPGPAAVQYGALAILGLIAYCLLRHTFPTIVKAQKEERTAFLVAQKEEREGFLETQKAARHDFRDSLVGISRSVDCLAAAISEARRSAGP